MWCLATIVEINTKLAEGKTLDAAYKECGITMPPRMDLVPNNEQKKTVPSLDRLLAGVTEENRHDEVDFGPPVGNEVI